MKKKALALLAAAATLILGTTFASAQTVTFTLLDIQGLVIGSKVTIDAAYGEKHGVTVASPFSILVPTDDRIDLYVEYASEGKATYYKVSFVTKDEQLIENVQFVPMTIGMGDPEARRASLVRLLTEQVYPTAIAPYPQNKYLGWRDYKVAGMDGIEVLGEYVDPQWGHMYLRVVGYLNPKSDKSVFAVSNISAKLTPIADADEFPSTRSGVTIGQLEFLD